VYTSLGKCEIRLTDLLGREVPCEFRMWSWKFIFITKNWKKKKNRLTETVMFGGAEETFSSMVIFLFYAKSKNVKITKII